MITGGTRGIGRGIAESFAAQGAAVVLGGRSAEKGEQALDEMGIGDRATFVPCDVRRREDVENLIDQAVKRYGSADIMVNNAGGSDSFALVHEMTDEAWQNALDFNLNAVFWGTRRALRYMLERGWGRIINISSVEGKQGNKPAVSHYITNKHAINGLTKAVATEYGTMGITCNAICPGAIETDTMKELPAGGRRCGHHVPAVSRQLRGGVRDQAAEHGRGSGRHGDLARERAGRRHHRRAHQRRRRHLAVVSPAAALPDRWLPDRWLVDWERSERMPFYTRANAGEVLPDPASPLGWTLVSRKGCCPGGCAGWSNSASTARASCRWTPARRGDVRRLLLHQPLALPCGGDPDGADGRGVRRGPARQCGGRAAVPAAPGRPVRAVLGPGRADDRRDPGRVRVPADRRRPGAHPREAARPSGPCRAAGGRPGRARPVVPARAGQRVCPARLLDVRFGGGARDARGGLREAASPGRCST